MIDYGTIKRNGIDCRVVQYEGGRPFLEIEKPDVFSCSPLAFGFFTKEEAYEFIRLMDEDDSLDCFFLDRDDYASKILKKMGKEA